MSMGRMAIFGKKGTEGQSVLIYMAFGLLAAGLVVTGVVNKSLEDIKGQTLEKKYIARDIALVLDAVYAVPGDLEYIYSEQSYPYVVEFKDGKVCVTKSTCDAKLVGAENAAFYSFYDGGLDASDKLSGRFAPNKNSQAPLLVIFEKKNGVVSVRAENSV